ncbi:hypothetical protein F0562_018201 [Nyssa sinensis]|uniref:Uncharacterized protein n=1 Tax=Nyssa sinensis TaxID=561372 RepID=A0A5J4ZB72_9ASTE|nr:hypothetical protein F0562_018201 [Nyssa sinensis]
MRILCLVNIIDLSSNNLSGEATEELTNLSRLGTLNLSINHLTGKLPEKIGSLQLLETLDLSRNQLSGPIPPSMTSLTSMNHLNLSYNNFPGQIPSGNRFGTLNDPSIYEGNPALSGLPLTIKCNGNDENSDSPNGAAEKKADEDGDEFDMLCSHISMGTGFVVRFWGVCVSLLLKRSWRHAYFKFIDDMKDRVSVFVTVNLARLRRKMAPKETEKASSRFCFL